MKKNDYKRYPISFSEMSWRLVALLVATIVLINGLITKDFNGLWYFVCGSVFTEYILFFCYKFRIFRPEEWWRNDEEKNNEEISNL